MLIRVKRSWELPESAVTSETATLARRRFLRECASAAVAGAGAAVLPGWARAATSGNPAARNAAYSVTDPSRPLTPEKISTEYNNFYEFSLEKTEVHELVGGWKIEPWTVEIAGLVRNPKVWDVEDLVKKLGVEERIYRFRCVEAWSMVVPWTGFEISKLLKLVEPRPEARYVRMTSFHDEKSAPNFRKLPYYPWPYVEGLTLEEAMNPLALFVTGMYGKPLPRQNGAPIRLIVPWKYGFKSLKSIVRIELTAERPVGLWEKLAADEYGFYANVNPEVDHPRWSQASERVIDGSFFPKRIPTLKFNGYETEVAGLYKGLDLRKNF